MAERRVTAPELAVLEGMLPAGMTADVRSMAQYLYEPLLLADERCGRPPAGEWLEQLQAWARLVIAQLQHLCEMMGGASLYLPKGVAVILSARDREMCAKFRGDYKTLAREYGLTEMRVRQIVDAWQRERFLARQQGLPLV